MQPEFGDSLLDELLIELVLNACALLGNDPQARLLDYGIDGAGQISLTNELLS